MNVMYKFTGQKVVATTSKSFDDVVASLDEAVLRVPGMKQWDEARLFRDNSKQVDSIISRATGPSGFILLDDLAWGYEHEWSNKGPARRRVVYLLGTRTMAKAMWNSASSAALVTPLRVMVVEGRAGQSSEVHYDLISSRERAKEAIDLDKRMAAMVETVVGTPRRRSSL